MQQCAHMNDYTQILPYNTTFYLSDLLRKRCGMMYSMFILNTFRYFP